jgi:hypothetical protein
MKTKKKRSASPMLVSHLLATSGQLLADYIAPTKHPRTDQRLRGLYLRVIGTAAIGVLLLAAAYYIHAAPGSLGARYPIIDFLIDVIAISLGVASLWAALYLCCHSRKRHVQDLEDLGD